MVDKVINGMISAIIGAVAFIAIQALVDGNMYDGPMSHHTYNASNGTWDFGNNLTFTKLPYNSTNASANEVIFHDILPLTVAILVVVGIFMGLTHLKGV